MRAGGRGWQSRSVFRTWVLRTYVIGLCLASLTGLASAQVPRIQGQGSAASAMSNAFAAQADDPSALHYNPAGMTQLQGIHFMAGRSHRVGRRISPA